MLGSTPAAIPESTATTQNDAGRCPVRMVIAEGHSPVGHLTRVALPSGRTIEHLIGPDGGRVTRAVDGTRTDAWVHSGGRIRAALDASGELLVASTRASCRASRSTATADSSAS